MGLLQRLEMRQGQALVMTPQLLQAIKLLQLSHLDLATYVDAELERNPLLERAEAEAPEPGEARGEAPIRPMTAAASTATGSTAAASTEMGRPSPGSPRPQPEPQRDRGRPRHPPRQRVSRRGPGGPRDADGIGGAVAHPAPWSGSGGSFDGEAPDFEATLTAESSLHEHLSAQLELATRDPVERLVGGFLVDAVDEAGYLREDLAARRPSASASPWPSSSGCWGSSRASTPRVWARDLAECLAIQLREQDRFDPAMQALVSRLDLVAKRDFPALRRLCGVDEEDLADMLSELRRLDPSPAAPSVPARSRCWCPTCSCARPRTDPGSSN